MILILETIFVCIFGVLLHFTYDISKHNKVVGIFSVVNESVWEHIKLALTPMFLYTIIDLVFYLDRPNYFLAKFVSVLTVIIVIPTIFYGYKSILKKDIPAIDISSFFIAVLSSEYFMYLILKIDNTHRILNYISLFLFILIFIMYLTLTFFPIKIPLFKDPITNKYGFLGHKK